MMKKLISCGIIAMAGAVGIMLACNEKDDVNYTSDDTNKCEKTYRPGPPPRRRDTSNDTSEDKIDVESNTVECKSSSCGKKFETEHGMKTHYGRMHKE